MAGDTDAGADAHETHRDTAYLDAEVNILKPSTPFMRDHLRVVWVMFGAWALVVFGPVLATWLATDTMTATTVLGFPLHYLLTAVGGPGGALVLSFLYARRRDRLDEKYGIDHEAARREVQRARESDPEGEPVAVDGGESA